MASRTRTITRTGRRQPGTRPQVRSLDEDSGEGSEDGAVYEGERSDDSLTNDNRRHRDDEYSADRQYTSEDYANYSEFEGDNDPFHTQLAHHMDTQQGAPAPRPPSAEQRRGKKRKRAPGGGAGGERAWTVPGRNLSRMKNTKLGENEDWVPVRMPSVYRIERVLGEQTCNPTKCYFCRHVGYNLPWGDRTDMQKLVDTVNGMIEGADPILTAQHAATMYNTIRQRSERHRLPHEDSLPDMSAHDILVHMRGNTRSSVTLPNGDVIPADVLPHNRTPENSLGLIRDMLLEKIILHYRQGSISRASAEYTTESGDPYLMLDKHQADTWLKIIDRYIRVANQDPQKMHGYVPAENRVVTNLPQGTLDTQHKHIMGISAMDTERNHDLIQNIRASYETNILQTKRLRK